VSRLSDLQIGDEIVSTRQMRVIGTDNATAVHLEDVSSGHRFSVFAREDNGTWSFAVSKKAKKPALKVGDVVSIAERDADIPVGAVLGNDWQPRLFKTEAGYIDSSSGEYQSLVLVHPRTVLFLPTR
jgi:hypothetical protein